MPTLGEIIAAEEAQKPSSPPPQASPPSVGLSSPPPILPTGVSLGDVIRNEPPPPFSQQLKESTLGPGGTLGPQSLLTIAGGAVGVPLMPFTGPETPLATAALGSIIGKGIEDLWNGPKKDPLTTEDWIKEMAGEGFKGVSVEAGGGISSAIFSTAFQKAIAPFEKRLTASQKLVIKTAEDAKIDILASQARGSGPLAGVEAFPTRFSLGSGPAIRYAKRQVRQAENAITRVANSMFKGYGKSGRVLGKALESDSEIVFKAAKGEAGKNYDVVEGILAPDSIHPVVNFFNKSSEVIKEEALLRGEDVAASGAAKAASGVTPGSVPPSTLDPMSLPSAVLTSWGLGKEMQKGMTFARMRAFQSRLGDLAANEPNRINRRTYARLYSSLMEDMDEMAKTIPGLGPAMTKANEYYRREIVDGFLKNEMWDKINQKDASELVQVLFPKGTTIEEVERVQKVLSPPVFKQLGAGFLLDLVKNKSRGELGEFSIRKYITNTAGDKYTSEVLKAILGKEAFENTNSLRKVFLKIQESNMAGGNPGQTARAAGSAYQLEELMKLGLWSSAGLVGLHTLGIAPIMTGAIIGFGPILMAKALYSKSTYKFLTTGLKLGPVGKELTHQAARIPTMLGMAQADWPWDTSATHNESDGGGEITTPQTQAPLIPSQGVPVEIPR